MQQRLKKILTSKAYWFFSLSIFLMMLGYLSSAWAQGKMDQPVAKPLVIIIGLAAMSLLPLVMVMMTSFIKIAVVLSLVRNAMGTQQIPPNQIITGLSIILTVYIMAPVGIEVYRSAQGVIEQTSNQAFLSQATFSMAEEAVKLGREPVRAFLTKHATEKDRALFYNLAKKMRKAEDQAQVQNNDFLTLVPAFVVSELSKAFQIGFILFLPFLVIDMVVANILLSLGMFQLSPVTVSLPFKLLLFVLIDGWYLIARGLILGYT
ncbi:MAG: type III secretion system export apparatus subunit SctR [Deltaproteobacteria bacterium]|nr:type III secretion system export apparatus subunit SctR [Deltaproteobacteria bacterium]